MINVRNLSIRYGQNVVIDKASFEVEAGDFVCVVGANGSGKSTLIKTLLGLITDYEGEISFGDGVARTEIGYLPQETKIEQMFPATVEEIVLSGALGRMKMKMFYGPEEQKRTNELLKQLRIENLKRVGYRDLSGGQKQKVLLARALMATSSLLFLDEPSNNLDYKSRKSFYKILKELNRVGMTIMMITHDLDVDDLIGNKVFAIKDRKVSCKMTDEFLGEYR